MERAPKRKRIGLKSKVFALEEQVGQVQSKLDNVVQLLERRLTGPPALPASPSQPTLPVPAPPPPPVLRASPLPPAPSLAQWVRDVAAAELRGSSEGEAEGDDEAEAEGTAMMRQMLRAEEAARLEADGHVPHVPDERARRTSGHDALEQRGTIQSLDPVDFGLVADADGQHLFALFFQYAHPYMPVYDERDTWSSLRQRSPFSITVILFVGKKIQDAGGPASDVQKVLREHAENMARTTLFSPVSTIDALQAMIILASWGDTGWRPGSHAISMAFDMDLYRCLPRLERDTARHRGALDFAATPAHASLVTGARLWLLTSKMAIEMAFNHNRPLTIDSAQVLDHAHALLDHASSRPSDGRIVAACELLLLRLPLHKVLVGQDDDGLNRALQVFNEGLTAWDERWREYYRQRGVSPSDILVSDHTTQRCFSCVLANSCLLRKLRTQEDVHQLSVQRQQWLRSAIDAAQLVVGAIVATERIKLIAANHYSHVALASVARITIRLVSLFPDAVDLRRTARRLTQLADILSQLPGLHFAHQLHDVIRKARRRRVFPPETRAASPSLETAPLTHRASEPTSYSQSPLEFDVFAADQLLNWDWPVPDQPAMPWLGLGLDLEPFDAAPGGDM